MDRIPGEFQGHLLSRHILSGAVLRRLRRFSEPPTTSGFVAPLRSARPRPTALGRCGPKNTRWNRRREAKASARSRLVGFYSFEYFCFKRHLIIGSRREAVSSILIFSRVFPSRAKFANREIISRLRTLSRADAATLGCHRALSRSLDTPLKYLGGDVELAEQHRFHRTLVVFLTFARRRPPAAGGGS
jgi:hypothetical protein